MPGPSPGEGDDLVFSGAGSGCDMGDEDECIPVFDTGSGDDLITPLYIPPTLPPMTKPSPKPHIPDRDVGIGVRPCDDEEDCCTGSGSGEFSTEGGVITEIYNGDDIDIEFPAIHHPMVAPGVIHSEEHNPSSNGSGPPRKDPGSGPTTTTTTTKTTTQTPRTRQRPQTTMATPVAPPSRPQEPPFTVTDYEHEYPYPEVEFNNNKKSSVKEDPLDQIHSEAAGNVALIISIIAGALIIVILIILLILKFKGCQDGTYKVDESKNYEGIPTMPTPMINGQGNGTIKPGDRRPV
nr:neurexin-3-beta-like [Cherax quadricarinatus]